MEKIIDAVVTAVCVLAVTMDGQKVLKGSFLWIRKASLTKAAKRLPPLGGFARGLTRRDHGKLNDNLRNANEGQRLF